MVLGVKPRKEPDKAVPMGQDLRAINGVPHDPNWAAFYANLPPPTPERPEDLAFIKKEDRRPISEAFLKEQKESRRQNGYAT